MTFVDARKAGFNLEKVNADENERKRKKSYCHCHCPYSLSVGKYPLHLRRYQPQ